MDPRRQAAAEDEARALRQEVVRWVRTGEAGQLIEEALRDLFRQELARQVQEVLRSQEVREAIHDQLAERVRQELEQALTQGLLGRQIVDEIGSAAASKVLDQAMDRLGQEILSEVRRWRDEALPQYMTAASHPHQTLPAGESPPLEADEASRLPEGRDGTARTRYATVGGSNSLPQKKRPRRIFLPLTLAAGAALLISLGWFAVSRESPPVRRAPSRSSLSLPSESQPPDFLGEAWLVLSASPPGEIASAQANKDLGCWFPRSTRDLLNDALTSQELSGPDLLRETREAFPDCVASDYGLSAGGSRAEVVQAAQKAALQALTADGEHCLDLASSDSLPDLARFNVDGIRGPATYSLLNTFLECEGIEAEIDSDSPAADYLLVLYLFLESE